MKCLVHLLLASILLYLSSCSASERFSRLIKNHPELMDTSMVSDTFLVKGADSITIQDRFVRYDSLFVQYRDTCINNVPIRIKNPALKKKIIEAIRDECGLKEGTYLSNETEIKILKSSDGHYYLVATHKEKVYKPEIIQKVGGIMWAFKYWYLFIIAALLGYIAPKILSGIIKSFI